jgi:hypothetical protein
MLLQNSHIKGDMGKKLLLTLTFDPVKLKQFAKQENLS